MKAIDFRRIFSYILSLALIISPVPCVFAEEAGEASETFRFEDYEYIVVDGKACITKWSGTAAELSVPGEINGYEVASIGDRAFVGRRNLTGIELPDSVASIGVNPFVNCTGLKKIVISPDHPALAVIGDVLFSKADQRLVTYLPTGDTEYTVPNGITSIDNYAFYFCDSLISIELPDSLVSIGKGAFFSCSSLTNIVFSDSVVSIGDLAFYSCSSLTSIVIPDSVVSIGEDAFSSRVCIKAARDSYAAQWAEENGNPYEYPDS